MTHHELCLRAAEWLHADFNTKARTEAARGTGNAYQIPSCRWVAVEMVCVGSPCHPDVFGWGDGTGTGFAGVQIEVKMSHSDFLADRKKAFRDDSYFDLGYVKYYCCPQGVIKPDELPDEVGLLYENGGVIEVVRVAPCRKDRKPPYEVPFLASVMRRLGIKPQVFDFRQQK